MELTIKPDLTLQQDDKKLRLTTAKGFAVAQTLIRLATRQLVAEEMGFADPAPETRGAHCSSLAN
jgi:hypothetical protein